MLRLSTILSGKGHITMRHNQVPACLIEAEFCQGLDPARGIALDEKRFMVDGRIPVVLVPFEHEEESTWHFVADSWDRAFTATPDDERLELQFEHRSGTTDGMSELAR